MLQVEDFLSVAELEIIDSQIVNNDTFPWYHNQYSSSADYPFYGHLLMRRGGEVSSDWYDFFYNISDRFIREHLLIDKYEVIRACLNDSLSYEDECCVPHVDFTEEHTVIILYLTNTTGATNLYKEQWKVGLPSEYLNKDSHPRLTIEHKIEPKQGKIISFNGLNYHSVDFKACTDRRIICILAIKGENNGVVL